MSVTFDEEHLNHPTTFLQPPGTLRSSSPPLVRFCEIAHLQKINQRQMSERNDDVLHLPLQIGPGVVALKSETPQRLTGDLSTGDQVPACGRAQIRQ